MLGVKNEVNKIKFFRSLYGLYMFYNDAYVHLCYSNILAKSNTEAWVYVSYIILNVVVNVANYFSCLLRINPVDQNI